MEGKKSFILYADMFNTVDELNDAEMGQLFRSILQYVNGQQPDITDRTLRLVFKPIMFQLQRDAEAWEQEIDKRSKAGKKGGLKSGEVRSKRKQSEAKASSASNNEANQADNVTGTVNVTVTGTDTVNDNVSVNDTSKKSTPTPPVLIKYNLAHFESLGYKWEMPEPLRTSFEEYLAYRQELGDPVKSSRTVEQLLQGFMTRRVTTDEAIEMIKLTIRRGAKHMIYELPDERKRPEAPKEIDYGKTGYPRLT